MKILGLYNNPCAEPLFDYIEELGHTIVRFSDRLDVNWCKENEFDLTVSYTYKYIIKKEVIDALSNNVVNIHNSYLPYNRGAAPNLWSLVEGTPRGVTLHYVDEGLDKGFIIAQKLVTEGDGDTLASSYDNLDKNAIELFKEAFLYYENWTGMKKLAQGKGSYHSVEDTKLINACIDSYEMRITDFLEKVRKK